MGYFSNGSEGDRYQVEYCDRCINWRETEEGISQNWGCPVIDLHMEWNYEQNRDTAAGKTKRQALQHFIPIKEDTFCDKCKMFFEKPGADVPGQIKMFAEAK